MAKLETCLKNDLVMLSMGWYGKFAMPVDAATNIIALLVKSGAVKVEGDNIASRSILRPVPSEWGISPIKEPYLSDCPEDSDLRKEYFAWLQTKADLLGTAYVFESYADYLKAREGS